MSAELGAVIADPKNGYAQLDTYNFKSVWAPPVSPIVPPMQYIHLPHEYNNFGYNSLSHDYNGVGYYTVESGYGNRCTAYHTAQCPNNAPIRPPAGPIMSTPPPIMERFSLGKKKPLNETIQDLQLVIFVDTQNCPHCKSIVKMLENNQVLQYVQLKEISNPQYFQELKSCGGNGVPFIKSLSRGSHIKGAPATIDILINELEKKNNNNNNNNNSSIDPRLAKQLSDLDITVYTSDSCGYCRIYKSFLEEANLFPYIKIVDLTDKQQVVKDPYLQTNQLPVIPFTYSNRLKTSFEGLPRSANKETINEYIQESIARLTSQSP